MSQDRSRCGSRVWRAQAGLETLRRRRTRADGAGSVVALGLTGGIGAGKSTALALLREFGALTVSADEVVHHLYTQPEIRERVVARFGPDVLDSQGEVDRRRLADLVGSDDLGLVWLEELTHPRVAEAIEHSIAEAPQGAVIVCEVPLLFESGSQEMFDLVVTIEAGIESRKRRSTHGFEPAIFSVFEELQASSEVRVAGSDLTYVNDGDVEQLRGFVQKVYEQALRMLEEGS